MTNFTGWVKKGCSLVLFVLLWTSMSHAGDTLRISLDEFIERGIKKSSKIEFQQFNVKLADNRVGRAEARRFLPKFQLSTQHGLVPGVVSDSVLPGGRTLPEDRYYLDPGLENDWNDWAVFTRADIKAAQPVFAWGAIDKAISAARAGASSAREEFKSKRADLKLRLYELYFSYVLSLEIERLLEQAQSQIDKIERKIRELQKKKDADIDQSEVYKFNVYKSQFSIRKAEVLENARFVRETWNDVLQPEKGKTYEPSNRFIDPVEDHLQTLEYYKKHALKARSELERIKSGIRAAKLGLEAKKAQSLPAVYLGITASYANTPNRPRQDNPFIINNTNYATAGVGVGIRQNLNFHAIKSEIKKQRLQYNKIKTLKNAAENGIMVKINKKYKEASLARAKMNHTDEALTTSKKWLRQEQLDYDLGMGETKDLIESLKTKLEMEVDLKRRIFDYNKNMAELYRSAGIPLSELKIVK